MPRAGEEGEEVSSSVEGPATSLNPRLSQATGVTSKWQKRVNEVGPRSGRVLEESFMTAQLGKQADNHLKRECSALGDIYLRGNIRTVA